MLLAMLTTGARWHRVPVAYDRCRHGPGKWVLFTDSLSWLLNILFFNIHSYLIYLCIQNVTHMSIYVQLEFVLLYCIIFWWCCSWSVFWLRLVVSMILDKNNIMFQRQAGGWKSRWGLKGRQSQSSHLPRSNQHYYVLYILPFPRCLL